MSARPRPRRPVPIAARAAVALSLAATSVVALAPSSTQAQAAPAASLPDTILVRETLPLRVRDVGPGRPGRMLRGALERPYVAFGGDSTRRLSLRRDTSFATTVVVLGRDAAVASRVAGDVIVIGGDLFLHPGAAIEGRAIAYGGAVYNSTLATVRGGVFSYRDLTFDRVRRPDEISLRYRDLEQFHVPLIGLAAFGFHLPEYTRVDGAVVPWGPTITLADGGVEIVPTVTYRSHLGAVDPAVSGALRYGRRNRLEGEVGRGTFSNDRWIRSNLLNSITTLVAGTDTRNYFRADRAEARASRMWETERTVIEPFVGARVERAWSVGPDSVTERAPWSLLRRGSREGMLRFNPPIARGRVASALAGGRLDFEEATLRVGTRLLLEAAPSAPGDRHFAQLTWDGEVEFPTFRDQTFEFFAHAVTSTGDAPPQRWAYLGGSGTLRTLELLERGGDQLVFADSRYHIPIDRIVVPFLGSPRLTLRHAIGGAGVGGVGTLVQNVGARVALGPFRVEYAIDPATQDAKFDFTLGFTR
jgi:hypothetical protein